MIKQFDELLERFDDLERSLIEYVELTNLLGGVDLEQTEETDALIKGREEVIGRLKVINPLIFGIINAQDKTERELVTNMMRGEMMGELRGEEYDKLYGKILNVKSLQGEIIQKDKVNNARFQAKYNEVKSALMDIKKERQKIDFYNSSQISGKGYALNSNG